MLYSVTKLIVSAVLIVLISEVGKRSSWLGGLLASLPVTSLLAISWLYIDTHDVQIVASLSTSIFWLVIPSLAFFISLPILLRMHWNFWISLSLSLFVMIACYLMMVAILRKFGAMA